MMAYRAPELLHGSDMDVLVQLAAIVAPDLLRRDERAEPEDRLWIWVEGDSHSDELRDLAHGAFQVLLGLLRAWRTAAGTLREEEAARLAYGGSARDEKGNSWVFPSAALSHSIVDDDLERFATRARDAIEASANLTDALWVNGRPHRTSADYVMIREYAGKEFGRPAEVSAALNVTQEGLILLQESANNLAPRLGGRHVGQRRPAPWSLDEQRAFTARLLRNWIDRD